MKIVDIDKNQKYHYDKFIKIINKIIKNSGNESRLKFSIFDWLETEENYILAPDIESNDSVFRGKCLFYCDCWCNKYKSRIINNPTWKDIIIEANNAANGDHIFLEAITLKKTTKTSVKYYELFFGS